MFNIEDINKYTSNKLKISLKEVEQINEKYWKVVKKELNDYNSDNIKLIYLGTFNARFAQTKRRIRHLILLLKELRGNPDTEININKAKRLKFELANLWVIKNKFATKSYNVKLKNK